MKNARIKIIIISAIVAIAILVTTLITISIASTNSGIAKSVTFTDDIEGAYVYFRAVDAAGNVGEWSEPQRIWIDTKAPNVSAKESSVTIEEGTVATLEDYFTVEANGGNTDIDVVCTIGGVEYTDTETLTAEGSPYTVLCEASKNGGNSKSAEMELVVEPSGPEPWDGTVATSFARGSGTEADPYIIETPQQLAYLASTVNEGTTYADKHFRIEKDLDLGGEQNTDGSWSGQNWVPIGGSAGNEFMGSIDGGGNNIYNIYCNHYMPGVFGSVRLSDEGYFRNWTIKSGYIEGTGHAGGFMATLTDTAYTSTQQYIENLTNYADVNLTSYGNVDQNYASAGGIVGNESTWNAQYTSLINYGKIHGYAFAGGIVGISNGENSVDVMKDCVNFGELSRVRKGDYAEDHNELIRR